MADDSSIFISRSSQCDLAIGFPSRVAQTARDSPAARQRLYYVVIMLILGQMDFRDLEELAATLTHDRLRRLLADWLVARGDREFPSRADFTPESLFYLLGNLVLYDVFYNPLRFRYRLAGSNLVARRGFEMTGKWLHEHPEPAFREIAIAAHERLIAQRTPERVLVHFTASTNRIFHHEVLLLPLSNDGKTIDMLLCGQIFADDI